RFSLRIGVQHGTTVAHTAGANAPGSKAETADCHERIHEPCVGPSQRDQSIVEQRIGFGSHASYNEPMNWPNQTSPAGQRPSFAADPMWPRWPTSTNCEPQADAKAWARSKLTRSSSWLASTMDGKGSCFITT